MLIFLLGGLGEAAIASGLTGAPHRRELQSNPKEMRAAAENLEFERAAELRDRIGELKRVDLGLEAGDALGAMIQQARPAKKKGRGGKKPSGRGPRRRRS